MFWLRVKIAKWLGVWWTKDLVVGGHCGCCGKWIPDELFLRHCAWWICDECQQAGKE